jgi:antitoxin component of RelBE/YafQ-DinJ toxin-antitoxin module
MPSAGNPVIRTRVDPEFKTTCVEKSERTGIELSTVVRAALQKFMEETDEESLTRFGKPLEGVATP